MKKILIFLSVFICGYTHAQTYLKGNVLVQNALGALTLLLMSLQMVTAQYV